MVNYRKSWRNGYRLPAIGIRPEVTERLTMPKADRRKPTAESRKPKAAMRNPKNLTFWADLTQMIVRVYRFSSSLPKDERFNLIAQVKRAAVSVRLNVVEGAACESGPEFSRFLEIAYRSAKETQTCVELAAELELCKSELVADLITAFRARFTHTDNRFVKQFRPIAVRRQPVTD